MFNPPNQPRDPGSYVDLLKRMARAVGGDTESRIIEMLQQAFESELAGQNVLLSRPERVRLFRQVSKAVLDGALAKIEGAP